MGKGRLRWGRDGRIGGLDETVWCDVNRRWKDGEAGLKQKWSRLEKQILIICTGAILVFTSKCAWKVALE